MITDTLRTLFIRDLNRLYKEVSSYTTEGNLWKIDHEITNSGGNLALHLVGNLNSFISDEIGGSGYVRERDKEFNLKDVPIVELLKMIEDTKDGVDTALEHMDPKLLEKEYPILVFKEPQTYQHFLMHLATHLTYHLGQINYHRRLMDNAIL